MKTFEITGMSCTMCSSRVSKVVSAIPGVSYVNVNLLSETMVVDGNFKDDDIISAVTKAGYGAALRDLSVLRSQKAKKAKVEARKNLGNLIVSLALLLPLMYLGMGQMIFHLPLPEFFTSRSLILLLISFILCLAVMVINRRFFISGFKALIGLSPNMDTLVSLGSAISFVYSAILMIINIANNFSRDFSYYFESAAMILVFVSVGKMLESKAKLKTVNALDSLADLMPATASIIENGTEKIIPAEHLRIGDIFAVRPGDKFPADGSVLTGISSADESAFTGESMPKEKAPGDYVLGAAVNLSGFLTCRVEKIGDETALSEIIRATQNAASTKAPVSRLADKISAILVPAVMGLAVMTFGIWLIFTKDFAFSISRAISVLVITCPCSLGLATPVSITVSEGMSAGKGILFKNAAAIEELSHVKTIAFDKTGTLTNGQPEVTDIISDIDEKDVLRLIASLEYKSEHPLGKAIVSKAQSTGLKFAEASNFKVYSGSGVSATIEDSEIFGGSVKYMSEHFILRNNVFETCDELSKSGKTPLIFTKNGEYLATVALIDVLKPDAANSVNELKKMDILPIMITGDNSNTAKAIADQAGINTFYAEISPEKKSAVVDKLKENSTVAMVGDGINDAPALTGAHVGIAMGSGTDIAIESADLVIMTENIQSVVNAVKNSKKTMKNIKENLFWAFFYNILCIPLAAGVWYPAFGILLSPMWCALCMSLSSFCVVMNSLRLTRQLR